MPRLLNFVFLRAVQPQLPKNSRHSPNLSHSNETFCPQLPSILKVVCLITITATLRKKKETKEKSSYEGQNWFPGTNKQQEIQYQQFLGTLCDHDRFRSRSYFSEGCKHGSDNTKLYTTLMYILTKYCAFLLLTTKKECTYSLLQVENKAFRQTDNHHHFS